MPQYSYDIPPGYTYKHISTQATTVVKATSGVLRGVYLNGATTGAVITLYDNASAASGTVIAIITVGSTTVFPSRFLSDLVFVNGLTILTATQNADITVLFT